MKIKLNYKWFVAIGLVAVTTAVIFVVGPDGTNTGIPLSKGDRQEEVHVAHGSLPWRYASVEEIAKKADAVVVGSFTKVIRTNTDKGIDFLSTDYMFTVEKTLSGTASGQIIVHQMGGIDGKKRLEFDHDPLFKVGERYVLMLRQYAPNQYYVLGGHQGRLPVVNGLVQSMSKAFPADRVEDLALAPTPLVEFEVRVKAALKN